MNNARRSVLKACALTGAYAALPAVVHGALADDEADLVLRLIAAPATVRMRPGPETRVLRYTGEVLRGRRDAMQPSPGTLGPTLELRRGERVRIEFVNRTGMPSVTHWHGMIVPDSADGHPHLAVAPGSGYTVEFTVRNPAGTYLYHPHPHGLTGEQTYHGLAGLLIVRDPVEDGVGLPRGDQELALVLQDRRLGRDNQLVYKRTMMDDMNGVLGDRVLVNGIDEAAFKVAPRVYRLRFANASNARIYKIAWSDGRPLQVIAADSGLFSSDEGVQERAYATLFPFERIELLEDFGARRDGAEIALLSRSFAGADGMMGSMMGSMTGRGGMMGSSQGQELHVARFTVSSGPREPARRLALPKPEAAPREGANELHTQLAFRHMRGFLNGRRFEADDMKAVANDERLPTGKPSVWTFTNDGDGMAMSHPIHIHGVRFRIIDRRGGSVPADLREGMVDAGYRDTFGIFPGERVRLLVQPELKGLFMYHCHNLEHEDGGMMRNVLYT